MRPLVPDEIVPLGPYAAIREVYRRAVIAYKAARRVEVGPSVSLLFEDRETLRFQVQEMLFVERISAPSAVQHEVDVYNELMPAEGELSATLMVQITEAGRIRAELDRLIGIDEHVALVLGEGGDAERVRARFDPKQFEEERISAVQYIRFALDGPTSARFADPSVDAAIEIDHPVYRHRAELTQEVRASLAVGLHGEPASLVPEWSPESPAEPLFENGAARIVPGPEGVRVESLQPFGALDGAGWAELCEALRRALRAAVDQTGGAQFAAEPFDDGEALRIHVGGRRTGDSRT